MEFEKFLNKLNPSFVNDKLFWKMVKPLFPNK